jgi:hypothetical protein
MGRRPIFDTPLSATERKRRWRARRQIEVLKARLRDARRIIATPKGQRPRPAQ